MCPCGIMIKYHILRCRYDTACGRKKNQSLSLLHPWCVRSCLNFHLRKMSSYFVTAGIQSRILYPLSKSIQTLISLEMPEQILSFMILLLHQQEGKADMQNTENVYQRMMISHCQMKKSMAIILV